MTQPCPYPDFLFVESAQTQWSAALKSRLQDSWWEDTLRPLVELESRVCTSHHDQVKGKGCVLCLLPCRMILECIVSKQIWSSMTKPISTILQSKSKTFRLYQVIWGLDPEKRSAQVVRNDNFNCANGDLLSPCSTVHSYVAIVSHRIVTSGQRTPSGICKRVSEKMIMFSTTMHTQHPWLTCRLDTVQCLVNQKISQSLQTNIRIQQISFSKYDSV